MSETEKIEIRCDTDSAVIRIIIVFIFIIVTVAIIYGVDPVTPYLRGQVILGETGVLIVRLFYIGLGSFLVFWIFKIYFITKKDLLLSVSQRGLKVNDEGTTIIEWENIAGFKVKTMSGWPEKEIHKIIVFPKDGHQGKIVKIDIYCSGLKIDRFKEIVNSFSSDLVDKIT